MTGSANLNGRSWGDGEPGVPGVGVVNGSGGATTSFNALRRDPGTEAADGRITFSSCSVR